MNDSQQTPFDRNAERNIALFGIRMSGIRDGDDEGVIEDGRAFINPIMCFLRLALAFSSFHSNWKSFMPIGYHDLESIATAPPGGRGGLIAGGSDGEDAGGF